MNAALRIGCISLFVSCTTTANLGNSNLIDGGPMDTAAGESTLDAGHADAETAPDDATSTDAADARVRDPSILRAAHVSAGRWFTLAVDRRHRMLAWGQSWFGALGELGRVQIALPKMVSWVNDAVAISAGGAHAVAVLGNGSVVSWGHNNVGQLGDGTREGRAAPMIIPNLNAIAVQTGTVTSYALHDGHVWAWGDNSCRQLSEYFTDPIESPRRIDSISERVAAISVAPDYALALLATGDVVGWGCNVYGQLGRGIRGEVGEGESFPQPVTGLHDIEAIVACLDHAMALDRAGQVWTWGQRDALGREVSNGIVSAIAEPVAGLPDDIISIGCTPTTSAAVSREGTVHMWGSNFRGQLGIGSDDQAFGSIEPIELEHVHDARTIIGATSRHFILLRGSAADPDGYELWTWGDNEDFRLGLDGIAASFVSSPTPLQAPPELLQ